MYGLTKPQHPHEQPLTAAGWHRAICAVAAALALALILLFVLIPEPLAAHAAKSGSAFSATTADTCTLPRVEARGTAQHILNKGGGGPPDAYGCPLPGMCRAGSGADAAEVAAWNLEPALPAQDHAARTAQPRAPPQA